MTTPTLFALPKFDKRMALVSGLVMLYFVAIITLTNNFARTQPLQIAVEMLTIPMFIALLILVPLSIYKWYLGRWKLKSFAFLSLLLQGISLFTIFSAE